MMQAGLYPPQQNCHKFDSKDKLNKLEENSAIIHTPQNLVNNLGTVVLFTMMRSRDITTTRTYDQIHQVNLLPIYLFCSFVFPSKNSPSMCSRSSGEYLMYFMAFFPPSTRDLSTQQVSNCQPGETEIGMAQSNQQEAYHTINIHSSSDVYQTCWVPFRFG